MKIHILKASGNNEYQAVIHTPMPTGNNLVGKSWKSCYLAGEKPVSVLVAGTNPGNTTQAEIDDVVAGNVIEINSSFPAESGGATSGTITQMVDAIINKQLSELQVKYKYYGYTQ